MKDTTLKTYRGWFSLAAATFDCLSCLNYEDLLQKRASKVLTSTCLPHSLSIFPPSPVGGAVVT